MKRPGAASPISAPITGAEAASELWNAQPSMGPSWTSRTSRYRAAITSGISGHQPAIPPVRARETRSRVAAATFTPPEASRVAGLGSRAMSSTQYYTAVTLDGFIADPDDSLEWLFKRDQVDGG